MSRTAALERRLASLTGEGGFTISGVARLFNVHPETIRKAEREGRIPAPLREQGGVARVYTPTDIAVLKRYFDPRLKT